MKIKGVIFDVDGVLLNSMPVWMEAGERYLAKLGIQPRERLGEKLFAMTMAEGAGYIKAVYGLEQGILEIVEGINGVVKQFYFREAPLKEGGAELLAWLSEEGIPITAATSTDYEIIEGAFERLGISGRFRKIFTCTQVGAGKDKPLIYEKAAECMGTLPEETCVLEDALHALITAKSAGFYGIGVYDAASADKQDALEGCADLYGENLFEILEALKKIKNAC